MKIRLSVLVTIMTVVMGIPAYAAPSAPDAVSITPIADEYSYIANSNLGLDETLVARGSQDPGGSCLSQFESFLRFDLGFLPSNYTVTSAVLTVRSTGTAGTNPALTMNLYGSENDVWQEGATEIRWEDRPQDLLDLFSTSPIVATGADVVFQSTSQFVDFLNSQNQGNDLATLAIKLTACSSPFAGQNMSSREGAVPPQLTITAVGPNAVTLTDSSAQQTNSLPLYAGLGALALVAAVGVGLSRRRTAAR